MRPLGISIVVVLLTSTTIANATETTSTASISVGHRALASGAAIFPGLILHGAGHWVAGDTTTGTTLLAIEGIGVAGTLSGIVGLALTGASRRTVLPLTGLTLGGVGMFLLSFVADLYGVIAPGIGIGRDPRRVPIEADFGVAYVADRVFDYGAFATMSLQLRLQDWRLAPSAWVALDDDNARLRAELAYRILGDPTTYLDAVSALTHHHYGTEGFAITTAEIAVQGRLDLRTFGDSLRGSFVEGGLGIGLEAHRFFDRTSHAASLLLGGFGFGMYLPNGEAAIYYDHRHDGFASGLKLTGLGSGAPGHLGVRATQFFSDFGVRAEAETGSAHVVRLALVYRGMR